jgi:hypothetical protein
MNKLPICKRRKRETLISGLQGWEFRECEYPNINMIKLLKLQNKTLFSGLRGLELREFQNPNIHIIKLPNFESERKVGLTFSGFWVLGFRDFKGQTSIHNNFRSSKSEAKGEQHYRFRGLGLRDFKSHTSTHGNS